MKEPLIVSIPHSGTRFLQERLGIPKFTHTINKWDSLLNHVWDKRIVAPLRDPQDVWVSWARRKDPFPYAEFFGAWYTMHALDLLFEVDFICVDLHEDPRITDWTPFGTEDKGFHSHPPIELRPLYHLPFVRRHYR